MPSSLDPFFNPSGVAVIGASANPQKLSHGILYNLVNSSYSGRGIPGEPRGSRDLGQDMLSGYFCSAGPSGAGGDRADLHLRIPEALRSLRKTRCKGSHHHLWRLQGSGGRRVGTGAGMRGDCQRNTACA